MLAAILFSTRFATQSSRILRLETGKELLALGTSFSLLFLPIFAYFRKNKRNVTSHFLPELVSSYPGCQRLFLRGFWLQLMFSTVSRAKSFFSRQAAPCVGLRPISPDVSEEKPLVPRVVSSRTVDRYNSAVRDATVLSHAHCKRSYHT